MPSPDHHAIADQTSEELRRGGAVLVEFFSSQGCGTSPEAEVVATRLGRGDLGLEVPVVVLVWHVDYWDYRGWKDPFGSSVWTVRQKAFVDSLRLDTLYTPQVVVHGRAQCMGTDEAAIVDAALAAPRFPSPTMQVPCLASSSSSFYFLSTCWHLCFLILISTRNLLLFSLICDYK